MWSGPTNNSYNIRSNISPHSLDADNEMEDCPAEEGQTGIDAAFIDHILLLNACSFQFIDMMQ
jgi:hypothetical protein